MSLETVKQYVELLTVVLTQAILETQAIREIRDDLVELLLTKLEILVLLLTTMKMALVIKTLVIGLQ